MKYRLLTSEELSSLEEEFIQYLVVNGITADDWQKMKQEKNQQAQEIVRLFSEVVFEGIFRKVTHLERKGRNHIQFVSCKEKEMQMIALRSKKNVKIDFEQLQSLTKAELAQLDIYQGKKTYQKKREEELFDLVHHQGYFIVESDRFDALQKFIF